MCGIAGAVALAERTSYSPSRLAEIVTAMSDRIVHRGPDGSGLWVEAEGRVALAHRRLAIVDLSDLGRQPMAYANDRYRITFNGEIYNFRELSRELQAAGCVFSSTSDTEVLLAAIAQWGLAEAVRRMVGMFAFAVWDATARVLHLARDRLGEKPLHVLECNGYLFFASEVRAFRAIPDFGARISSDATISYLTYGYVPEPLSVYEGMWKLPPGSTLSIPASRDLHLDASPFKWTHLESMPSSELRPVSYWSCGEAAARGIADSIPDAERASFELEAGLRNSVRSQMRCDVPVGSFLSGGIDSSLVTAVMQAESAAPVHTFTVSFDDPRFDESVHARAIATHLGTIHEEFKLTQREVIDSIPTMIDVLDEPTANASIFPVHLISKFARTRVKVILSGDGGDELFGGYNRYLLTPRAWAKLRLVPLSIRKIIQRAITGRSMRGAEAVAGFLMSRLSLGSQVMGGAALAKAAILLEAGNLSECYGLITSCWQHPRTLTTAGSIRPRNWPVLSPLESMLLADQKDYLPGDSLAKVDRASMAASLETRLPLLDHRIVEFSWRVPQSLKIQTGLSKWLMRSVLYRFVPRELIERPKMGFTVPLDAWLAGPLRDWASDALSDRKFREDLGFSPAAVDLAWHNHARSKQPSAYQLWALVAFAAWYRSIQS